MTSIILLSVFGIINLFLGFLKSNKIILPVVMLFLLIVLGANYYDWDDTPQSYFSNMLIVDNFSVAFTAVMVLSLVLIMPFSRSYVTEGNPHLAEFYSLLLFSLVGAVMMVSYENLLMLFIGIEILSIAMYVLAGSHKKQLRSNEAALKYLLMGSFATGILLFGIALIYGAAGSFNITEIATLSSSKPEGVLPMLEVGILMVLIGICFKIGAAPFHFWTPDVYEGTPTLFTAYMSTVVKTAGIAAFYKLVWYAFPGMSEFWYPTLAAITVLTLVIGNVGAASQVSFKRMLAYSSIAHAGYLLIALTSFNDRSENAILFYTLTYTIATVAAFGVLKLVSDQRDDETYAAFNGLAKTNPLLAFAMTVAMCSLASIPLTGGFFAKFFIFGSAIDAGAVWLVVVAILMSAVSIYYYFRVVVAMYMKDGEGEKITVDPFAAVMLVVLSVLTILLGVLPGLFNDVL